MKKIQPVLCLFILINICSSVTIYGNPWFDAAKSGDADALRTLHSKDQPIDELNMAELSALHIAVMHSKPAAVKVLLELGANVNLKTGLSQKTPLQLLLDTINKTYEVDNVVKILSLLEDKNADLSFSQNAPKQLARFSTEALKCLFTIWIKKEMLDEEQKLKLVEVIFLNTDNPSSVQEMITILHLNQASRLILINLLAKFSAAFDKKKSLRYWQIAFLRAWIVAYSLTVEEKLALLYAIIVEQTSENFSSQAMLQAITKTPLSEEMLAILYSTTADILQSFPIDAHSPFLNVHHIALLLNIPEQDLSIVLGETVLISASETLSMPAPTQPPVPVPVYFTDGYNGGYGYGCGWN